MNSESKQKRIAFGYYRNANNQITRDDGQAACVQLIFQHYVEGKSLAEIKEILERLGIPSPHNNTAWGKQVLSNILSNPHYVGSKDCPEIVSEVIFDKTQEIKNKKNQKKTGLGFDRS